MSGSGRSGRRVLPGLEGLRGLAVVVILCFHAGVTWVPGGFLALTTFFTLSGFLVATLLLRAGALHVTGPSGPRTSLAPFWSRRARRLVPAGLAGLALVVAFEATVADLTQQADARGDVLAALASLLNWRFILEDQAYADLFGSPSPALHYWSLSVEVQYYALFPVVFLLLVRLGRAVAAAGFVALAVTSAVWGAWLWSQGASYDRIYYGTDTRAAELLVGASLALALAARPLGGRNPSIQGAGALALGGLGLLVATVDLGAPWLVQGGFLGVAVLSAVVVLAAAEPGGPVRWLLALGAFRALGRWSYGIYLFHWPLFLWLRQSFGWTGGRQLVVGGVLATVLAAASFRFLEAPVRAGDRVRGRSRLLVPLAAVAALVAAVVVVDVPAGRDPLDAVPAAAEVAARPPAAPVARSVDATEQSGSQLVASPRARRAGPPRVLVVGDEGAMLLARSVSAWDGWTDAPDVVVVDGVACGPDLATAGDDAPDTCAAWVDAWGDAVAREEPDLAILAVANLDVEALLLASGDATPDGLDAADATAARDRVRGALAVLGRSGARVVVAELPPGAGVGPPSPAEARMGMGYSVLRDAAMGEPGVGFVGREQFPPLPAGADSVAVDGWPAGAAPHLAEALRPVVDPGDGSTAATGDVPRVLVVGDSVSWFLGHALEARAADTGDLWAWNAAVYGCGIGRGGEIAVSWGAQETAAGCDGWAERWGAQVEQFDPDVVVALTGLWDLTDRRRPEWGVFRHVGDPVYDEWLLGELAAATDVLSARGARVVWLTSPCTEDLRGGVLAGSGAWDPARLRHLNEVLLPELDRRRDDVVLADLHALACPGGAFTQTIGGHPEARRDGVHFSGAAARHLADLLLPEVLAAGRRR